MKPARRGAGTGTGGPAFSIAELKAGVDFRALVAETHAVDRAGKVSCPAHNDHTPSCHVYENGCFCFACGWRADAVIWLERVHNLSTADAIRELERRAGGVVPRHVAPRIAPPARAGARIPPPRPDADRATAWHAEWQRALADHPLLRRYLAARGLAITLPPTLRIGYLYGAPYMLARVEGVTGALVGLHRTWLAPDGSARREKKLAKRSSVNGAAIRLYAATERLALAEGIETALAVHQLNQWPTWATISAGGMKELELPDSVRDVLICADHDRTGVGQDAAHTLARRLVAEGRRVRVSIPPEPDSDWLDVLTGVAE